MAIVEFAPFIQQYVKCPPMEVPGNSVREILDNYFLEFRPVRQYILDEYECVRPRLTVFVDSMPIFDRTGLSDPVHVRARIFVHAMACDAD
jgi:sulfur-carrier protein